MTVPGWPVAFRGSLAVAAGLVTKDVLRGPRFTRLFPDTYVAVGRKQDLTLRSHAAYRYVEGRGVLSGFSAAEVLGASCGPEGAPAEVTVLRGKQREHPGLLVHRSALAPGEMQGLGTLRTTTPLRTAYDLARRGPLVERVVAVDALARAHRFCPDLLLNFAVHFPWIDRLFGTAGLPRAVGAAAAASVAFRPLKAPWTERIKSGNWSAGRLFWDTKAATISLLRPSISTAADSSSFSDKDIRDSPFPPWRVCANA